MNNDLTWSEQENMRNFIEIVIHEGNLSEILFTRTCLERFNRETLGHTCDIILRKLDERIQILKSINNMNEDLLLELLKNANFPLEGVQINIGSGNTQTVNITYGDKSHQQAKAKPGQLNEHLSTDAAKAELAKLQKAGMLDANYQPINLTRPQMGCIVIKIGALLGLESQWKDFGCLWNIDSELLRTQFGRGKDSEPTRKFYKKIYDI